MAAQYKSSQEPPPSLCVFTSGSCSGQYDSVSSACTGTDATGDSCAVNTAGDGCMVATGSCTFSPAQTEEEACLAATFVWTPDTCETRVVDECADASGDQATCEDAGTCTFSAPATCETTVIPGCDANADEETCTSFVFTAGGD